MNEKETLLEKLGRLISMAGNAVMMNLLFLAACLPIVTIGQAWCGLLSAIRYNIRGDSWFQGFKYGYKTRFLRGTIAWCVLLVVDALMLIDVMTYSRIEGYTVQLITACVMFALMAMLIASVLTLNVYIPTNIGNWLRNAANMIFKAPLQLLSTAALMWLPVLLFIFWFDIFYFLGIIFVVVYFPLVVLGATILLKDTLVEYLVEARSEGTLLAEEGKRAETAEEETAEEE